MRLKIYSILFVCIFACMFYAFVSSFDDFLRIFVFQWAAFLVTVGMPLSLMIIVFSFFYFAFILFIIEAIVNKRELNNETEISRRRLLFSYSSFSAVSSAAFFALISVIGAINMDRAELVKIGKFLHAYAFIGFLYGIAISIFSLIIRGAYKKMRVEKEINDGYMVFGEIAAITASVVITLGLIAWMYFRAKAVV